MLFALLLLATTSTPPDTLGRIVPVPGIEVSTTRPGEHAPVARSTLLRDDLLRSNTGQDTPMLLAKLPGAYAYSDAGNGIGYSYLSIRGFPQRRISVLINGVPLNDPQSHEVYWIDHPDLLASTREVEVQRGVGSALYGAASLGGSVNLETSPFTEAPETRVAVDAGSYDTKRLALEMNSGRLAGGWNLYSRYSRIETQGYRDQSWSKLWSYALSARRAFGNQSLRASLYGGPEETHLAYLSVAPDYLLGRISGDADRDRRFNPLTYRNERDHYFEPHYELIHTWTPRAGLTVTQTAYRFDGKGYYDEQRDGSNLADYRLAPWATTDTTLFPRDRYADANGDGVLDRDAQGRALVSRADLVRRRLVVNHNTGWVPRVRVDHPRGTLTVGGELRAGDGRHYGEVISGSGLPPGTPPNAAYYDVRPRTLAAGVFAREEWRVRPQLLATADLAWRHTGYAIRDDHFDGIHFDQSYDFANPRLGLTWSPRGNTDLFASWAHAGREPALRDLFDVEGVGSVPLYRVADVTNNRYRDPLIRPETVDDFELGAGWRGHDASITANLFRMNFRDELVYAGQFNTDLGYPILGNAAKSVHQGVELAAKAERAYAGGLRASLDGNASLSDNHFVHYREIYGAAVGDTVSYDGNAIAAFPAVLGNLAARMAWRSLALGAGVSYAGRIYLDNTEQRAASIAPRTLLDLSAEIAAPSAADVRLGLRIANVFDRRYESGGYMDYDANGALVPFRTPAAGRNVIVQLRLAFR
jgi:iron complex outermembrane recepter protein